MELYLDRFPERGEKFRVSVERGTWPVWRRDGRELFHVSTTGDLRAVAIDLDSDRSADRVAVKLFSPRLRENTSTPRPTGSVSCWSSASTPTSDRSADPELGGSGRGLTAEGGQA
ncbi:MAG TPA: hypothetical protein VES67_02475 [Vicinamibacterales bacterium]|nr:hypothetical protein [Vicinamibacterales bacterium]